MYILIENGGEIRKAQAQLEATIEREFSAIETRDIGWQGGRQPRAKVHTDGEYWFWSSDNKDKVTNPRRLNWFGRINEGPGVEIAVEINTPYSGKNAAVAGFFARNTANGQTYLFHSGRVGGGAVGVKKDALVAWSDLELHAVFASDGSYREALLVMPITGRAALLPAVKYVQTILDFKAAVRNGYTETAKAKNKELKLRTYYDEFFGRKRGKVQARDIDYYSRHGEVVKALEGWRKGRGLMLGQKIVKSVLLDLGVSKGTDLIEAYEVKTSTLRGDVYTGIGQLIVHAQRPSCSRILALPAEGIMAPDLAAALKRNGIRLQLYRLTEKEVILL